MAASTGGSGVPQNLWMGWFGWITLEWAGKSLVTPSRVRGTRRCWHQMWPVCDRSTGAQVNPDTGPVPDPSPDPGLTMKPDPNPHHNPDSNPNPDPKLSPNSNP